MKAVKKEGNVLYILKFIVEITGFLGCKLQHYRRLFRELEAIVQVKRRIVRKTLFHKCQSNAFIKYLFTIDVAVIKKSSYKKTWSGWKLSNVFYWYIIITCLIHDLWLSSMILSPGYKFIFKSKCLQNLQLRVMVHWFKHLFDTQTLLQDNSYSGI